MRALVLSGAGAAIWAHAGAVRALREARIRIDYATGASAGAFVAALFAADREHRLDELADALTGASIFGGDGPLPSIRRAYRIATALSWYDGRGLRDLLERELDDATCAAVRRSSVALEIPAYDLLSGSLVWTGGAAAFSELRDAVLGSAAIPLALPPVHSVDQHGRERLFVDAGIVANHPIERAAIRVAGTPNAEVVVFSAMQAPASGPVRSVTDIASRCISAALHRAARADRETAEQIGVRVRWISLGPLDLELETFTQDEARAASDQGYVLAMEALGAAG